MTVRLPQVGDRVNYDSRAMPHKNALITKVLTRSGLVGVWLNDRSHDLTPSFNVHLDTGLPIVGSSRITYLNDEIDAPREFKVPIPPPDVTRLEAINTVAVKFTRDESGNYWVSNQTGDRWIWRELIHQFPGGFREIRETEYEAALRRLTGSSLHVDGGSYYPTWITDVRVVLSHALESRS